MQMFSKKTFIERIQERDLIGMLDDIERALGAEQAKRGKDRDNDAIAFLKSLRFWLRNGKIPTGIPDEQFQMFRPLAESLVSAGAKPTLLDMFDSA